jgi:hypothetical protein
VNLHSTLTLCHQPWLLDRPRYFGDGALSRLYISQTRVATLFIPSIARMFTAIDRVSVWHPVAWLPLELRRSARFGVDMRCTPSLISSVPDEN